MISLFLATSFVAAVTATNTVPLTMLDSSIHPFARCMDGTSSGYYYEQSTSTSNSSKWVIYLQGGGECDTESGCKYQLTNALGSSTYFPPTSDSSGWYLASGYCPYNPDFCSW